MVVVVKDVVVAVFDDVVVVVEDVVVAVFDDVVAVVEDVTVVCAVKMLKSLSFLRQS